MRAAVVCTTVALSMVCAGAGAGCDAGVSDGVVLPEHPMSGSRREVAPMPAVESVQSALVTVVVPPSVVVNVATTCAPNQINSSNLVTVGVPGCPGCNASGDYPIADAFDVVRLVYGGLHHDGSYDCNSVVRRALVATWANLFQSPCPAGNSSCPSGLTHAWRPRDIDPIMSGWLAMVGFPGRGIGSAAAPLTNPFCNSVDANLPRPLFPKCNPRACAQGFGCDGVHCSLPHPSSALCGMSSPSCPIGFVCSDPTNTMNNAPCFSQECGAGAACPIGFACEDPTSTTLHGAHCVAPCGPSLACPTGFTCSAAGLCSLSQGGRSDYADMDPIRVPCTTSDGVCDPIPLPGSPSGLGLVLPIVMPDTTPPAVTDAYPTITCDPGACDLQAPATAAQVVAQNLVCPDGTRPVLGRCFMPLHRNTDGTVTFQCRSSRVNRCFGLAASGDGRAYNKALVVPVSGRLANNVLDSLGRIMNASFFRIHAVTPGSTNPGGPLCSTLVNDTAQVQCLVNSDWCSVGIGLTATLPAPAAGPAN
jgi:hypothetical protein